MLRRPGFWLYPAERSQGLLAQLSASPSTGALALDLVAGLPFARIAVYGFDFFASLSVSGHRSATEVPHRFDAERALVDARYRSDPRFAFH